MPKLSPDSEGAQSTSAAGQLLPETIAVDRAERVDRPQCLGIGERAGDVVASRPDHDEARGHMLDERLESAQQNRQALALLGAADEQQTQLSSVSGSGRSAGMSPMSTPLGMIS